MELQTILILLGVLLLVGAFIISPFTRPVYFAQTNDPIHSALLADRERLLIALRELDFDHSLGKVPEEDYPAQRAELVMLGAEVLEQLDTSPKVSPEFINPPVKTHVGHVSDDDIEEMIAKRRSARKEQTSSFCPKCGKAVLLSDCFCPSCGHTLK